MEKKGENVGGMKERKQKGLEIYTDMCVSLLRCCKLSLLGRSGSR